MATIAMTVIVGVMDMAVQNIEYNYLYLIITFTQVDVIHNKIICIAYNIIMKSAMCYDNTMTYLSFFLPMIAFNFFTNSYISPSSFIAFSKAS